MKQHRHMELGPNSSLQALRILKNCCQLGKVLYLHMTLPPTHMCFAKRNPFIAHLLTSTNPFAAHHNIVMKLKVHKMSNCKQNHTCLWYASMAVEFVITYRCAALNSASLILLGFPLPSTKIFGYLKRISLLHKKKDLRIDTETLTGTLTSSHSVKRTKVMEKGQPNPWPNCYRPSLRSAGSLLNHKACSQNQIKRPDLYHLITRKPRQYHHSILDPKPWNINKYHKRDSAQQNSSVSQISYNKNRPLNLHNTHT